MAGWRRKTQKELDKPGQRFGPEAGMHLRQSDQTAGALVYTFFLK